MTFAISWTSSLYFIMSCIMVRSCSCASAANDTCCHPSWHELRWYEGDKLLKPSCCVIAAVKLTRKTITFSRIKSFKPSILLHEWLQGGSSGYLWGITPSRMMVNSTSRSSDWRLFSEVRIFFKNFGLCFFNSHSYLSFIFRNWYVTLAKSFLSIASFLNHGLSSAFTFPKFVFLIILNKTSSMKCRYLLFSFFCGSFAAPLWTQLGESWEVLDSGRIWTVGLQHEWLNVFTETPPQGNLLQ